MSPLPYIQVACGLVWHQGRLLISQRLASTHLGGYWEFPGGKVKAEETPEAAVTRELKEEVGLDVTVGPCYQRLQFAYPERLVDLAFYTCHLTGPQEPVAREVAAWRWVAPAELDAYPFPPANAPLLQRLKADGPNHGA